MWSSIICRKCQKLGRPMCTCWSERGVVATLKDVALPAVGVKMSTTNGNTAEIADPVGMITSGSSKACAQDRKTVKRHRRRLQLHRLRILVGPMEPDSRREITYLGVI